MPVDHPKYIPIDGKTYSLFGHNEDSSPYYEKISDLADRLLDVEPDLGSLLLLVRRACKNPWNLFKFQELIKRQINFHSIEKILSVYILDVDSHISSLSFFDLWNSTIAAKKSQYLLYMLEIELTNRLNSEKFFGCGYRFALLPHCLHDLSKECLSKTNGIEYVCGRCSKKCFSRCAGELLKSHGIEPFIWKERSFKSLVKTFREKYNSVGVFGIACIPELTMGMRKSEKAGIVAIGVPLDANRCMRWFGEFRDNSVNLEQIEKILTKS
jgi:hypothetical protein